MADEHVVYLQERIRELEAKIAALRNRVEELQEDILVEEITSWKEALREAKARAGQTEVQLVNTKAELRHMYTFDNQHRRKIAELTAQLAVAREVYVGVDKVASLEEEIGFPNWTPLWTDTIAKARAALRQIPDEVIHE